MELLEELKGGKEKEKEKEGEGKEEKEEKEVGWVCDFYSCAVDKYDVPEKKKTSVFFFFFFSSSPFSSFP